MSTHYYKAADALSDLKKHGSMIKTENHGLSEQQEKALTGTERECEITPTSDEELRVVAAIREEFKYLAAKNLHNQLPPSLRKEEYFPSRFEDSIEYLRALNFLRDAEGEAMMAEKRLAFAKLVLKSDDDLLFLPGDIIQSIGSLINFSN